MQETGPGAGWAVHWDPHHEAPFMYRWVGVTQHITRAASVNFNNVSEVYPDIRAQSAEPCSTVSVMDAGPADTAWQHYRLQTARTSFLGALAHVRQQAARSKYHGDCRD